MRLVLIKILSLMQMTFVYLNFKLWNTFLNKLDAFTCSMAFIVGIEKMAALVVLPKKFL